MDRFEQIIGRLNAHIKRWWIPIVIALFIFVAAMLVVVWHCYSPELAKFLGYSIGIGLLIWQIAVASRRAAAAEKTAELTERGNIAERFKNAIEHLGNDSASVRLGGTYALHHIAHEVEEYRKRVFEILCAHIRETTTKDGYKKLKQTSGEYIERKQPTIEIQSILNLLFIEDQDREIYEEFQGNLEDADLKGASFIKANLQNANLWNANLQRADLRGANLQKANLTEAKLQNANLSGANLQNANLWYANLQDANLWDANLQKASLWNANLQNAGLRGANLRNSILLEANLQNTDLWDANFQKANLKYAKNLEVKQLLEARTLYETGLPDEMEEEIRKEKPELFDPPDVEQES